MELLEHLEQLRERIQQRLEVDTALGPGCPDVLREAVRYSLLAPGKRVRPCLALLACEACGSDPVVALPAASALEMIHCYSLIHDDLPAMDDDDLRRGRPTCHIQFNESTAILAGDALLTLAFEVLAKGISPARRACDCILELSQAAGASGMVGGQQADLQAEQASDGTVEQLEAIHRRKTGKLLAASAALGGLAAGAAPETVLNLRMYGESVGLAFQIADDLLDITSTSERLGKSAGKDVVQGKLTYPKLLGEAGSRARARELVQNACHSVSEFGDRGRYLQALARYIIERDH